MDDETGVITVKSTIIVVGVSWLSLDCTQICLQCWDVIDQDLIHSWIFLCLPLLVSIFISLFSTALPREDMSAWIMCVLDVFEFHEDNFNRT